MPRAVEADLSGRTCVVTGATSGIGRETALALARLGARVVLVCRDPVRAASTRDAIATEAGHDRLEVALADLADPREVARAARSIASRHPEVHVLVNNAGTWLARREIGP